MATTLIQLSLLLTFLAIVFSLIEWTKPRNRRRPLLRRGLATDIAYWYVQAILTSFTTRVAVAIAVIPAALVIYGSLDHETLMRGFGPISLLPLWLQAIGILLISDFIGYWMHRAFHGRRLWPIHAIHHSSEHVDWLAAMRAHPLNDAFSRVATVLPIVLMGFAPIAVAGIAPFLVLFAILLHADVDWDWGPFRRVLASPRFHRWHHTSEEEARDRNFAGLFPIWDIVFGTYHMPPGRVPSQFGTSTPVPPGIIGQLMFPFRRPPAV